MTPAFAAAAAAAGFAGMADSAFAPSEGAEHVVQAHGFSETVAKIAAAIVKLCMKPSSRTAHRADNTRVPLLRNS